MRFDDFPVAFRIELHREKNSPLPLIRLRIRIQDCSIWRPPTYALLRYRPLARNPKSGGGNCFSANTFRPVAPTGRALMLCPLVNARLPICHHAADTTRPFLRSYRGGGPECN